VTQELSQCLQKKNQNIVHAIGLIGSVMRNMNAMRENSWDDLFKEVKSFCVEKKIDIPNTEDMMPVRGCSKFRDAKLVTHYHHFHHGIFIVVVYQILCELNNQFLERSTELLRCVACLDLNGSFANFEIEKLVELAKIYKDDFSDYDCVKLRVTFLYSLMKSKMIKILALVLILVTLLRRWFKVIDIHISLWCIISLNLH
jgi:hypothetical protein